MMMIVAFIWPIIESFTDDNEVVILKGFTVGLALFDLGEHYEKGEKLHYGQIIIWMKKRALNLCTI